MRIGFFTDTYLPDRDGIVYSIESFRKALVSFGHEVFVFAPRPASGLCEDRPNVVMLPAIRTPFDHRRAGLAFDPVIRRKISRLDLDLIHVHYLSTVGILGFQVALTNAVPLVSTWHTDLYSYVEYYPPYLLPYLLALSCLALVQVPLRLGRAGAAHSVFRPRSDPRTWSKQIVQTMVTALHDSCDVVIAPSSKAKEQIISWGTVSQVRLLPTGVDPLAADPEAVDKVRRTYRLQSDYPVVLYVGRLAPEKNIDLLIKSFGFVLDTYPTARLILVGDHKLREHRQLLVEELRIADRVIYTGWLDRADLAAIYAVSTLFVFPSMTDTQGIVLQEAALSGLPIVLVDGRLNDIVKDKVSGLLAENNPRSLADKILIAVGNPQASAQLARTSQEMAKMYLVGHQARLLERLYAQTLRKAGKGAAMP